MKVNERDGVTQRDEELERPTAREKWREKHSGQEEKEGRGHRTAERRKGV